MKVITDDLEKYNMIYIFENGKGVRINLANYQFRSSRKKLSSIYSGASPLVAAILEEGVSGEGGAKNARVDGYKVAAKTGTSQKFDVLDANGNSYLRIGSTVAFAPSDDSGIAVIIVVDEPTTAVKYGSVVAAPYISSLLTKIMPYLEYESNAEKINCEVENYVGLPVSDAKKMLEEKGLSYEIIGMGQTVISQTPGKNNIITYKNSKILLYTEIEQLYSTVPNLLGLELDEAVRKAVNEGLNICIQGTSTGGRVVHQSLPLGAIVKRGEVIILEVLAEDFED